MSSGSIIKREGPRGVSYLLKYEAGRDSATGRRLQQYKTVTGTKKDAETELRRLLTQIDTGMSVDPSKMRTSQWVESWLRDLAQSVSQRTLEGYGQIMKVYILPRIGTVLVQKLTAPTIQSLYTELLTSGHHLNGRKKEGEEVASVRGLSAQSVLHVHRALFACLKAATRMRVIARNPAEDVRAPNPKRVRENDQEGAGPIKALERDELKVLAEALRGKPLFDLVAVAAGTGLRRGEMLALTWKDVDFEKRTLRVNRAVGITRKFGVKIKDCPKNDSSRRTIGIDEGLCRILQGHRAKQVELASSLGVLYPADALVFPCIIQRSRGRQAFKMTAKDVDFTRPWHPDAVSKDFSRQAKLVGFPDLRLHDMRHTHATQLLLEGIPVHAVAHRLGHSTPNVTLSIYAHVLKRAEDRAAQVSGDLMSAAFGA